MPGIGAFDPFLADLIGLREVLHQPVPEASFGMDVMPDQLEGLGQHGVQVRPLEGVKQAGGRREVVDVRGDGGIQVEVAPARVVREAGDGFGFLLGDLAGAFSQLGAGEHGA
ncbi:hypothetical protein D3C72_1605450 [compost metagenome]